MIKRFVVSLFLAGATFAMGMTRAELRSISLEDLTARLEHGHGADAAGVARERASRMARLAQSDPAEALRLAMPAGARALLAPRVHDFVAEQVEVEGSLEVIIEDRNDGSRRLTFLETDSGDRYELSFASDPAGS